MDPVLIEKGKKVSLAILTREDAPALYRIINDPEVHRTLSTPGKIYSLVEEYDWIDNYANVPGKSVNLAIKYNETMETVGIIGINDIDNDRRAHIGYYLRKDYWGKGIMTEATALMVDYAFRIMNLRKLFTNVYSMNPASSKVLEKNGFHKIGTMKRDHYVPGEGFVDVNFYELLNSDA
ncbi:MAG: GNAT family N-acetyltransferase [Candidatus Thermoplasmatota archaeon]|jgi:RimJ/RimL family protein N-acetyltransferase|nr:GNAT family N-acetyltransferase [Candidatus Thermoplasmatota archaeon]MCL5790584.1 GNAT family N-acetyltransferase [Candidatus Thermoplasmatota archaeon]